MLGSFKEFSSWLPEAARKTDMEQTVWKQSCTDEIMGYVDEHPHPICFAHWSMLLADLE